MAAILLSFNDRKTEVIVFSPCSTAGTLLEILVSLELYFKQSVLNLGMILDSDLKFNKKINSALQKSFYS